MSTAADLYREILGRSPNSSEASQVQAWQNQIQHLGYDAARNFMSQSPEAQRRSGSSSSSSSSLSPFGHSSSSTSLSPSGSSFLSGLSGLSEQSEKIQGEMWDLYKSIQLPYERDYAEFHRALLPAQYGYERARIGFEADMMPGRYGLEQASIAAKTQLLPYATAYGIEKFEADRTLLPHQTKTRIGQMDAIAQLRAEAAKGIDIERRVGQAGADAQAISDAQKSASQRDLTRMGINPASGRYAGLQRDAEISTAGNKLGAMNQARWTAETEDWNRRAHVAQGFGI